MIKRIIKSCLVVSMACALGIPAMAADVSINVTGRTRTWIENVAVKDSTTTMQMKADGRLGASVSAKAGEWTVTAFQNVDMDSDSGAASPTIREQKITLGNDTFDLTLGRFSPYGISKGMTYAIGPVSDAYWIGENVPTTDVTDHLTVDLKNLGLTVLLGMNNYNDSATVGDARDETMLGAIYGKQFGPVDLAVEVLSASSKIDEKDSDAVKSGAYDGATFSALALGVGYSISDNMLAAFNYENNSQTSGISGAKDDKNSIMELWFDMGLDDTSGISVGYGMKENDDGSSNKRKYTMINLVYSKQLGIAGLYANYLATTEKDDDDGTDTSTSTVAAGMQVNF